MLLASFVGVVNAQVTTAAMAGLVQAEGDVVIGANVVAVHTPSGTTYGAVTNIDGRYTIQGMRTGGPYTVTVSYIGYKTVESTGITLSLGNTFRKDVTMASDTELLAEVVVVGSANMESGASSNFSTATIEATPTVDRNIYDVVKNMPMASSRNGGMVFAGSNNRYNSFQIDGSVSNDVFGLSSGGTNGDQSGANPISMEAVQEIQVVIAPFDVRQGGFTGGGINAITKQGDNTFHASVYSYYNNQDMYGTWDAYNEEESPLTTQSTLTYGATVSGAFIKDKLFFFANVEKTEDTYPVSYYPGYNDDYLSTDVAQSVVDKYQEYTGITESYNQRNVDQSALSMLARIDWNINDKHKLAVRYQRNDSGKDVYSPGTSTYYFENSGYNIANITNSFVAELSSTVAEDMHNEFRASATFVRDHREIPYSGPNVTIYGDDSTNDLNLAIGTEYSSGANYLNSDVYTIEDNFSWYKGDHTLTFGTHNEFYQIENMFIQAAAGAWYFDSYEDFMNNDPSKFIYKYTDPTAEATGGSSLWTPVMKFGQFGLYAQDMWNINNNTTLTYGLRFDLPVAFNAPTENVEFNTWAAEEGISARVGDALTSSLMVSPRVGFTYYTDDSHKTLLRGGAGIFTGRVPFVWVSNSYTNTGIEQKGTTIYGDAAPALGTYTSEELVELSTSGSAAVPDIVTVDNDFKFPQVARVNLALEQKLPYGVNMTLEGVYSKTMNNVLFENLALTQDGEVYAIEGVEASAMPYYTNETGAYNTIINLTNTNKGYTYALSAAFDKAFAFGLNLNASYTFSRAKSVNDGTSSVAYSNWKYNYSVDPNSSDELGYSKFDNPHNVILQASYTTPKYLNGLMQTTVGVVYNGYSGSRYCLTVSDISYSNDFNGDGYGGNNLLYIPTESELEMMNFTETSSATAEEQRAEFGAWIAGDDYASEHRGQYAERYSNLTPWQNQIDLHIAQDIFYIKERGSKVQLTFDVMNFANMLNKEWGADWSAPYNVAPVKVGYDSNGDVYYNFNYISEVTKSNISSRWHAQVGAKVIF